MSENRLVCSLAPTKLLPELPPVEATASCSHARSVLTQADAPQVDTVLSRYSDFECDTCEDHGTTLQEVILSKTKKCPDQLKCDPNMKQKL